jgi:hypothetical protein
MPFSLKEKRAMGMSVEVRIDMRTRDPKVIMRLMKNAAKEFQRSAQTPTRIIGNAATLVKLGPLTAVESLDGVRFPFGTYDLVVRPDLPDGSLVLA